MSAGRDQLPCGSRARAGRRPCFYARSRQELTPRKWGYCMASKSWSQIVWRRHHQVLLLTNCRAIEVEVVNGVGGVLEQGGLSERSQPAVDHII